MKRTRQIAANLLVLLTLAFIGALLWLNHDLTLRARRQSRLNQDLVAAVRSDNKTLACRLLDAGANPNAREDAMRPLPWYRQALDHLLHHQSPSANSGTPVLTQAAINGDVALVKALLAHGAGPNAHGRWSNGPRTSTALMDAASFGQVQTVKTLIQGGADVNARCNKDAVGNQTQTALSCAVEWDASAQTIPLLLAHGADVNAVLDSGNHTILIDAVNWTPEKLAAVKAVLAGHPDLSVKSLDGTALAIARKGRHTHIVALLRQAGAKQ